MGNITLLVSVIAGALALLFGRRLYWLFVGVAGFVAGLALAEQVLHTSPEVRLLIGIVVGVVLASLAVALQKPMLAIGGFLAFGAASIVLLRLLGLRLDQGLSLIVFIVVGIIGAIFVFVTFDWALIILSSLNGATTIVSALGGALPVLAGGLGIIATLVLLLIGIAFQAQQLRRT